MQSGKHQVFQTQSPTRWQRFKWTFRIVGFIVILLCAILAVALVKVYNPSLPQLKEQGEQYKAILQPDKYALIKENKINKEYRGFRKYINAKWTRGKNIKYVSKADSMHAIGAPIRAAFYVAWDAQSYFSLRNNISKLNMILPEWFFIDPVADTLKTNMDQRALFLVKMSGVRVVPVLSNFYHDNFNGESIHRIMTTPAKKERLINDLVRTLKRYKFSGINIDFEELKEETDEAVIAFMRDVYTRLHAENLLVTQDVSPFNDDYNYKELVKYNDYIFLMGYDQHNNGTKAGPISSQKWVEAAVDEATKHVPQDKLILCMACYGYDWPRNSQGRDLTYEEALSVAEHSGAKVDFDNDTYNLKYTYKDDNGIDHDVHFTDAATNFNTMRFAVEYGLAGVSIWRLGAEDSRLWWFYNKDLSKKSLTTFDFNLMNRVKASNDVDYIGEGEVLDVLSTPKDGSISMEIDSSEQLISEEHYESLPSMFVVKKYGNAKKKIVLSFDDGPDPLYTPQVLDILKKEKVPAVFFLVGINAENNIPLVKRIYREGYEIGSHSFTHPNMAEISHRRAVLELNATRLLIECITGHSTVMFRAPYNADSEPETMEELLPVALAKQYNYLTIGESIDPNDWEPDVSADSIYSRVLQQQDEGNIILLHDAGGDRSATVKALPRLIKYFKSQGYQFTTIADLVGKKKDELMPPVPRSSGYYFVQFNYYIAAIGYWGGRIIFATFLVCIVLAMLRTLFMAVLASLEHRREKKENLPYLADSPLVSIIVPAYNEEVNAVRSVQNLLKSDYPNFNIIFVDDGSKDDTYARVHAAFENDNRVKVFTKVNGGKASALNFGILQAEAEYVICIDADTHLPADALKELMKHFANEDVGAVAGNVKVGNEVNMLTRWQSIEYITSQNFDRKAFAYINAITVVPGAIGAFRKEAIEDAGGFTSDTFAEDCDLTIRILRSGYIIKNDNKALALTEVPETRKMFLKQRFRWTFGVMQAFWKNRDALFNSAYKSLGWVALPNILIFQILIPMLAPLAEVFMIIGILTGNGLQILEYYAIFMLVDIAVAVVAFMFEREKIHKLLWLIPQRIAYRWLMLYVLFKAVRRAIKGELQSWGVLKRTGNVALTD
ncbi:glycosyltransferase [Taibaiella soli]|uniref:Glycosyl transferase family 2 n=1 Tax=Taibaiella soli TaxID=1649169 RepID=A0A2W2B443_9BACT|nr:glycosyltransferase [Taibaiella soli]PZF71019.1 glycosyl transferase family 2 [Taibaiella soli]